MNFSIYNFVGDGWVLLFEDRVMTQKELIPFLKRLDEHYGHLFRKKVGKVLGGTDHTIGITAGIDEGFLLCVTMNDREEFVGRAMNVASACKGR